MSAIRVGLNLLLRFLTHLPGRVHARGLSLVQLGLAVVRVESNDQRRDTKGSHTTRLGVTLCKMREQI